MEEKAKKKKRKLCLFVQIANHRTRTSYCYHHSLQMPTLTKYFIIAKQRATLLTAKHLPVNCESIQLIFYVTIQLCNSPTRTAAFAKSKGTKKPKLNSH